MCVYVYDGNRDQSLAYHVALPIAAAVGRVGPIQSNTQHHIGASLGSLCVCVKDRGEGGEGRGGGGKPYWGHHKMIHVVAPEVCIVASEREQEEDVCACDWDEDD